MQSTRNAEAEDAAETAAEAERRAARRRTLLRWAPVVAVVLTLALFYAFGLHDYLSLETLRRYQGDLGDFVGDRPLLAAAGYLLVYVAAVAVSFPGASALTIVGGFLFGAALGTALAEIAATTGATLIFLSARTSLGDLLSERAGPRVNRLRRGFQEEGFSYLLFLRLVPVFPFWLVNLAAALFGMRLLPYVAATAIGILPGTFVFSYFGQGLRSALESESGPASVELLVALALLGLLALAPVAVRRFRRGRDKDEGAPGQPGA